MQSIRGQNTELVGLKVFDKYEFGGDQDVETVYGFQLSLINCQKPYLHSFVAYMMLYFVFEFLIFFGICVCTDTMYVLVHVCIVFVQL